MLANFFIRLDVPRFSLDVQHWSVWIDYSPNHAWKVNNLSAVCGALAATFVSWLSVVEAVPSNKSIISSCAAILSGLLFALTLLIWEYSVTAEVFALNNFLCSFLLFLTIKIIALALKSKSTMQESMIISRWIILGGFITGLALSNQHTSLRHVSYLDYRHLSYVAIHSILLAVADIVTDYILRIVWLKSLSTILILCWTTLPTWIMGKYRNLLWSISAYYSCRVWYLPVGNDKRRRKLVGTDWEIPSFHVQSILPSQYFPYHLGWICHIGYSICYV